MRVFLVAIAGAAGALARYGLGVAVGPQRFPWTTLGINVSGAFVFGFILTWATEGHLSTTATTAVTVGFLGAYTTFSTFAWESFALGHTNRAGTAAIYVLVSIVAGIAAAGGGYALGRALR